MKVRLLVYDPDPEGRRLFRKALQESREGCVAVIRASADSCMQALHERSFDTLVLGLPIDIPEFGDVVVFWRERRDSWKGHVGFFHGFSQDGTRVYCLGGNQGNP